MLKGGNKNCEGIKGYGKSLQECDLLILFVLNIRIQERSEGRTKEGLWINGEALKSMNEWMNEWKRSI